MTNQRALFWKNNMNFGAIAGLAIIIAYILLYFLNIDYENFLTLLISFTILISVIIIGTKHFKNNIQTGNINYGRALGVGTTISFFASVFIAFYLFIFYKFIDTEALGKIYSMQEDILYEQGLPNYKIEISLDIFKKLNTPFIMSILKIFSYTFWGFIFSLITSAFLKKKSNSYDAAMAEIEKENNEENK